VREKIEEEENESKQKTKNKNKKQKTKKEESKKQKTKTEKVPAAKAIKIRLYPTKEQQETLKKWFGTARWTYNQCLSAVKEGTPRTKKALRDKCLNSENFETENTWVKDTPYDVSFSLLVSNLML
jgi:hypothetical protein